MTPPSPRIAPEPAAVMRRAIVEADGVEVFAIGDVEEGVITALQIAARGREDRVNALLQRPHPGQVVIHNHPSGDLRPSDADMRLAGAYGEDGVGFVIVDSTVERSRWVVEPWQPTRAEVPLDEVLAVFEERLPEVMPGWEVRQAQIEMVRRVHDAMERGEPLLCEAGTGTGKSLAYLVPAAMWAKANDATVIVATHTRALQAQLVRSDLPLLDMAGLDVTHAVLEGRGNYLCKRRLGLAVAEAKDSDEDDDAEVFEQLRAWAQGTGSGSRSDLPHPLRHEHWERVQSDADLTLRTRCSHYDTCFFYQARRRAASAQLVVVNHALLLADLALRAEIGRGLLPAYQRIVLDEAHHLEDVATGAATASVTALAVRRAVSPLLPGRRRKRGALRRLVNHVREERTIPDEVADAVAAEAEAAAQAVDQAATTTEFVLGEAASLLSPEDPVQRLTQAFCESDTWREVFLPQLHHLAHALDTATGHLDAVRTAFGDHELPEHRAQALLDVERAHRRLSGHGLTVRTFTTEPDRDTCRWFDLNRRRGRDPSVGLRSAPIDVAPVLRKLLWDPFPGTTCTSATLSVDDRFDYWRQRHGLDEGDELILPSPFDHATQALLGLPRDLPPPNHPDYLRIAARVVVDAVSLSDGGAFVLCTSYKAVDAFAAALRAGLPRKNPILVQGTASRPHLLGRFRDQPRAVLVGTDSFWEGVSVKGDGLRLVIIPKLPFRVPSDPLQQARHERIEARGQSAFRAYTLPAAVLKLRQGYGRLIRADSDRGVVLLLDRRVHDRAYGRVMLRSLPPARQVTGPWRQVAARIERFYAEVGLVTPAPRDRRVAPDPDLR